MGPRKSCVNLCLHAVAEGVEEPNEEDVGRSSPGSRLRGAIWSAADGSEDDKDAEVVGILLFGT